MAVHHARLVELPPERPTLAEISAPPSEAGELREQVRRLEAHRDQLLEDVQALMSEPAHWGLKKGFGHAAHLARERGCTELALELERLEDSL